jgi:hypothetical protein
MQRWQRIGRREQLLRTGATRSHSREVPAGSSGCQGRRPRGSVRGATHAMRLPRSPPRTSSVTTHSLPASAKAS